MRIQIALTNPLEYEKQALKNKIKSDSQLFHLISMQLAQSDPGLPAMDKR
jgi:hypothetical protein